MKSAINFHKIHIISCSSCKMKYIFLTKTVTVNSSRGRDECVIRKTVSPKSIENFLSRNGCKVKHVNQKNIIVAAAFVSTSRVLTLSPESSIFFRQYNCNKQVFPRDTSLVLEQRDRLEISVFQQFIYTIIN